MSTCCSLICWEVWLNMSMPWAITWDMLSVLETTRRRKTNLDACRPLPLRWSSRSDQSSWWLESEAESQWRWSCSGRLCEICSQSKKTTERQKTNLDICRPSPLCWSVPIWLIFLMMPIVIDLIVCHHSITRRQSARTLSLNGKCTMLSILWELQPRKMRIVSW